MNLTPAAWRHVRIIDADKGTFSVVTFYVGSRFGPLSLLALGQDADTKTERISRAAALAIGEKLEKALETSNEGRTTKRRGR